MEQEREEYGTQEIRKEKKVGVVSLFSHFLSS
jgi:hypothetical protein